MSEPVGRASRPVVPVGIALMLAAVLMFSSSTTIVKWADEPGSVVAFWRMIGAVVLWWVVIGLRRATTGRPAPSAAAWKAVLPVGLLFGLNISLFFTAVNRTSIAHAEFIVTLSPLLLVPFGALFFGEHPDRRALAWGGLSAVGLASVLFLGGSQGGATVGGDLLVVLVLMTWVGYLLTGRRARATVDVVDFMSTLMPIGLLTAAPVAVLLAGDEIGSMSAKGWIAAGLLSVLTGMLGHGFIAAAQREVDVATIGIVQVSQPAIAVVCAYLVLGEQIRLAQVPGMVLVIVGLAGFTIVSQRRTRPRAATVVPHEHGELTGPVG